MEAVELRIRTIEEVRPGMVFRMGGNETFKVLSIDNDKVICQWYPDGRNFTWNKASLSYFLKYSTELTGKRLEETDGMLKESAELGYMSPRALEVMAAEKEAWKQLRNNAA